MLIALHIMDIMSFILRKRDNEIPFTSHTRARPAPDRTESTSARYIGYTVIIDYFVLLVILSPSFYWIYCPPRYTGGAETGHLYMYT